MIVSLALLLIGAGVALAVWLLAFRAGGSEPGPPAGWRRYSNAEFRYRIDYPADWDLQPGPTLKAPSGSEQSTSLRKGNDRVAVLVNYTGVWCDGSTDDTKSPVVVSGHAGEKESCTEDDGAWTRSLKFVGVNGQSNIVVYANGTDDVTGAEQMLTTFRLTR